MPVIVYELHDFLQSPGRAPVLKQATTDENGKYSLTGLPTGVDLIVVAATSPRLSAIVPAAGSDMTADVHSATALVAEAWAETLRNEIRPVSAAELAQAVAEAKQALDDLQLDEENLLDALSELVPKTFGDGLSDTPPPAFQQLVEAINNSVPGAEGEPENGDNGNGDETGADACGTGDRTEQSPYIICTVEQLQSIHLNPAGHYELGANINASATSSWNENSGF